MLLWRRWLRLPAWFVVAFLWTVVAAHDRIDARLPDGGHRDVAINGWVEDFPDRNPARTAFTLRVSPASPVLAGQRLRLSWYGAPEGLGAGSSVTVTARVRAPRGLANPHGFDYEKWLLVEGIVATGYVREGALDEQRHLGSAQAWLRLRSDLAARIANMIPDPDAAALVTALALGVRQGFTDTHWGVLRRTGTSHLVAISGLHVGLVAVACFCTLLRLALLMPVVVARRAWPLAAVATIGPVVLYAALAGFSLPTVRAVVMLLVAQAVILARRRVNRAQGFAVAVVLVLAVEPLATLETSFWLSFGAVGLLLMLAGQHPLRDTGGARGARWATGVAEVTAIQCALTLGLIPLSAHFFGEFSVVGLFVNLLAIPLFTFVLVPLSMVVLASAATGLGSEIVSRAATAMANVTWSALESVAAWPFAALQLPVPDALALTAAGCGIVVALAPWPLRRKFVGLVGLLPLFVSADPQIAPGSARLTVLDVGHGLAILIETRTHRLLYDTGPVARSGFDAGAEIVVPAIARSGSGTVELVVVSHADNDHSGGLLAVRKAFPDADILAGPDVPGDSVRRCLAGQRWIWDDVEFAILHPPPEFRPLGNESSCVLRIEAAGGAALITGDIESRAEGRLAMLPLPPADVVVVPHHGSSTSSGSRFVGAVAPRYAVVSAGFDNRWGLPRPDVVQRWREAGAAVLTTGDLGAITISLGEGPPRLSAERLRRHRYWLAESRSYSGE